MKSHIQAQHKYAENDEQAAIFVYRIDASMGF